MNCALRVALFAYLASMPVIGMTGYPQVTVGSSKLDPAVKPFVRKFFVDDDGRPLRSVSIDLNGDGLPEKFVPNEFLCGQGGCPWLVYDQGGDKVIGTIFGSSIEVMERNVNGYRVLEAYSSTGGAREDTNIYEFSHGQYQKVAR